MSPTRAASILFAATLITFAGCEAPDGPIESGRTNRTGSMTRGTYDDVPRNAQRVEQGSGDISYRVREAGTVWVADNDDQRSLVSARVRNGDEVAVKIDDDEIRVNDKAIYDQNLESKHEHTIFFVSESRSDRGDVFTGPLQQGRLPRDAQKLTSGSGAQEVHISSRGHVWVTNTAEDKVITDLDVRDGDVVQIVPDDDVIRVNGKTVYDENLERHDDHAIYFQSSSGRNDNLGMAGAAYGGIPEDARLVASGAGDIDFKADSDGRIWVGDDHLGQSLITSKVGRGDTVHVMIDDDEIRLNKRVIYRQNLESDNSHSIFFK